MRGIGAAAFYALLACGRTGLDVEVGFDGDAGTNPDGSALSKNYVAAYVPFQPLGGAPPSLWLWHSATGKSTRVGAFGTDPCFTRGGQAIAATVDGAIALFDLHGATLSVDSPPWPSAWYGFKPGARPDGQRFAIEVDEGEPSTSKPCLAVFGDGVFRNVRCSSRDEASNRPAHYGPDGKTLTFVDDDYSIVTEEDDGTHRRVVVPMNTDWLFEDPSFSFDGSMVTYLAWGAKQWAVAVVRLDTLETSTVFKSGDEMWSPLLTPDGTGIVVIIRSHGPTNTIPRLAKIDVATGTLTTIAPDVQTPVFGPPAGIAVAPDVE